jgi:hypothetical protein
MADDSAPIVGPALKAPASSGRVPWTRRVDNFLRFLDLTVQRLDAGTKLERVFRIERHTLLSYAWPALVCTAVLIGMPVISAGRLVVALIVLVMATVVLLSLARLTLQRAVAWDAYVQAGFVLACCGVVSVFGSERVPDEAGLYVHLLVPGAALFAVSILLSAWITPSCFSEHVRTTMYPASICKTQLFQRRPKPLASGFGAFVQGVTLLLARVPELLFPSCLVALILPREWLTWSAYMVVLPFTFLVVSGLDERVEQILEQLSTPFFKNGGVFVSAVVIALGIARFRDVDYVATVLDTAAGAQIAIYLFFAYAVVWWQDYWIMRLAAQQMLRIAGGSTVDDRQMRIDYAFEGNNDGFRVPADGRRLQLHGLGRFLVLRPRTFERKSNREQPPFWIGEEYPAFHTWRFEELFNHVASHTHPNGDMLPSPQKIAHRLAQHASIVRVCTVAAIAAGLYALSALDQVAAAEVSNDKPGSVNLGQLIEQHPAERPVILVAASGGGTRAALYTAAILEGLERQGSAGDVLLGSGVSGGGASLAYFAGMRNNLDWDAYFKAMQASYIRDVLERSSEWRVVAGRRLGTLLEESFDRHWALPSERTKLGQVTEMGLILNTAIAGHSGDLAAKSPKHCRLEASSQGNSTQLAGGRLILTNLQTDKVFDGVNGPYCTPLPIVVHDPEFKLSAAAALNANFPPVFSNAPIDVDQRSRYWVTDGGAADNRGAEMLLYSLRHALKERPSLANRRILVLIVDAGAAPGKYSQDRGIGSAMGAGTQFAMHLVAELARDVGHNVRLQYLPMPAVLRESFGTHWMLQGTIRVGDDHVNGTDMVQILRGLYANGSCDQVADETARRACLMAQSTNELCDHWVQVRSWVAGADLPLPAGCPAK